MSQLQAVSRTAFALIAAVAVCTAAQAAPFAIDTSIGAGADAYVRGGTNGNNTYGTLTQIVLKDSPDVNYKRKGYVRFDLAALGGKVLTDATLTLDVALNNGGGSDPNPKTFQVDVFGLTDGHAGEGWAEAAITWNNAPANAAGNGFTNGAVYLGRFAVLAQANPTVTLADPALASFLNTNTDGQATLLLTRISTNGGYNLGLASHENTTYNAPALSGEAVAGQIVSLTTNDGGGADSFVQKGEASTNFGNNVSLFVKNAGTGGTTRKGYLRFDLSGVEQGILDAGLTLEVTTNNPGGSGTAPQNQVVNVFGLDDADAGESWGETTITWSNAPANDTNDNDLLANATLLGQFFVPAYATPQKVLFASQELTDFLNADTDNMATLILTRQSSNGSWNLGFGSGEHTTAQAPTLTLALEPVVPEPCTLVLTALGAAGMGWYSRRRRRRR